MAPAKAAEVLKKPHRRSSMAGVQADGPIPERKPLTQIRSFMEVKRSEEAYILKALRLEEMVTTLQADLAQEQLEALGLRTQVVELKTRLGEVEKDKDTFSNRCTSIASELATAQQELKELKSELVKATNDCTAAKTETAASKAAAAAACERMKALTEVLQRRGTPSFASASDKYEIVEEKEMVLHELQNLQAKVHEQDEFASSLNELHNQVEKTRQEIRARLSEASAKASALGLAQVQDKPLSGAKPVLSLAIESESSTSSWREGECTPQSKVAEGDLEFSSFQKSLSRQLSDLSALSRRSSIPGLQSEDSNEGSPEYVSLLAIPEAAKSLVAVKSQTQFDSPVGAMAASPAYHRRKASDAGVGCTLDLSQRFGAEQTDEDRSPGHSLT
ncbi:hypothetical protein KFL_000800190 [Klebsormidium nitens]|uniref:Uncharacterized protein n=1 Tax=Klebsormidium nitens TaxID=105231 RepID=A0A1Y1HWU0_KLENI|nr:hypothetical protein KFL_000800190 [Klebsormidium nitens]|eukprot:GAQ81441.1 hypothetical protein KFL_000800190 [Klebsormidium nitens]